MKNRIILWFLIISILASIQGVVGELFEILLVIFLGVYIILEIKKL